MYSQTISPMKTREEVVEHLQTKYTEADLHHKVSEAIFDFLDDAWEEDGYDDEEDWYREFGRGEAESQVSSEIQNEILEKMGLPTGYFEGGFEKYKELIGESVWETIESVYPFLDT